MDNLDKPLTRITTEAYRRLRRDLLKEISPNGPHLDLILDRLDTLEAQRKGWDTPNGIYVQRHIAWMNKTITEQFDEIDRLKKLLKKGEE